MMEKPRLSETLLEFLKENQRTVNQVIKLSSEQEPQQQYPKQQPSPNGVSLSEVLEKMTELIELNKVTLQTIDLLDKRVKRMYIYMSSELSKIAKPQMKEEQIPQEEGEKVEYNNE